VLSQELLDAIQPCISIGFLGVPDISRRECNRVVVHFQNLELVHITNVGRERVDLVLRHREYLRMSALQKPRNFAPTGTIIASTTRKHKYIP